MKHLFQWTYMYINIIFNQYITNIYVFLTNNQLNNLIHQKIMVLSYNGNFQKGKSLTITPNNKPNFTEFNRIYCFKKDF